MLIRCDNFGSMLFQDSVQQLYRLFGVHVCDNMIAFERLKMRKKRSWPDFRYYAVICVEDLKRTTNTFNRDRALARIRK
jgi:hypothetical protein